MATKYESYIINDDLTFSPQGVNWVAQSFTPSTPHTLTSVKLLVYKEGSPGFVTVGIRDTDGSGNPANVDIGPDATDRLTAQQSDRTIICLDNPANTDGIINQVEIWANTNMTGCRIGTFYLVSGNDYKCRDSATIGAVTSGSKQTFTEDDGASPLAIAVEVGDFIGTFADTGLYETDVTGFSGILIALGEHIDSDDQATYTLSPDEALSIYATGVGVDLGDTGTTQGNDLTTNEAGEWKEVTVGNVELTASIKYAIVVRVLGGDTDNKIHWRVDWTGATYAGGNAQSSADSSSNWTDYSDADMMFEEWGDPAGWAGGDIGEVPIADIAKISGVALANILKVSGVA